MNCKYWHCSLEQVITINKTLTLIWKLVYVAGETIKAAEYLVADPTAQVIMKVEDDQINILEEHSQVNLKNARTIAIHGHLRLVVDSHAVYGGQIIPNPEAVPIDKPSNLPNMSDIEFTKI
ncbi:unnamed protein product [Umbelopsis vinacea]